MAIPETIKKLANDIRTKIYGREVREALAQGIEEAGNIADQANQTSNDAVEHVRNIQAQVDQLVVEGDSSVEAAQARVDADGNVFTTLKERLDTKETQFENEIGILLVDKADKTYVDEQLSTKANQTDLVVERSRIDNLIAVQATTDNAETADIRVDIDGITHSSAGESVRSQLRPLYNSVLLRSKKKKVKTSVNLVSGSMPAPNASSLTPNNAYASVLSIRLKAGDLIGFIDDTYRNTYKFAIGKKTDSSWIGGGYQTTSTYKITEEADYAIMLTTVSGGNDISGNLATLNSIFGVLGYDYEFGIPENYVTEDRLRESELYYNVTEVESVNLVLGSLSSPQASSITPNTTHASVLTIALNAGDVIGFADPTYYNTYKFAIGKKTDSSWIGGGYRTTNFTVTEDGNYAIMLYTVTGGVDLSAQINTINSIFGKVVNSYKFGVPLNYEKNPLYGKKIGVLGDSFAYGHTLGTDKVWLAKIASRNNMTAYNYGINGNCIAGSGGMAERYTSMINDLDYVVVIGGHNDANQNIPIGTNSDSTIDTYKGALNVLINGLITKYPLARILFLTPFNRYGNEKAYADAMIEMCGLYSIPCFNCYTSSGVNFYNDAQRAYYDLKVNGSYTKHLTELGHEFFSYKVESLLKSM